MKKQLIYTICGVLLLTIAIVGSTYAFFQASVGGNRNVITNSSDFEVIYTGGNTISGNIPITYEKTNQFKTTINIRMGENSVLAKCTLYINIEEITSNLRIPGFVWEVYKIVNGEEVLQNKGDFDTNANVINIVENYELTKTNSSFVVYVWVDGSKTNNDVLGGHFTGTIGAVSENFTGEL